MDSDYKRYIEAINGRDELVAAARAVLDDLEDYTRTGYRINLWAPDRLEALRVALREASKARW